MSANKYYLDVRAIMDIMPHRYPFLLVDRVVSIVKGESLHAFKNVTINEPFFQGHFPGLPVMPGVLIMEAMAQAGGVLVAESTGGVGPDDVFLFSGMDKVRFRRPVVPGDRLDIHLNNVKHKLTLWKMLATAKVDGEIAAQGELSAVLTKREAL